MPAIYQSDVFCDSCAAEIKLRLTKVGKRPEDSDNETTYDSDEFPKWMDEDQEADTPQHCGGGEYCIEAQEIHGTTKKVGKLLSHTLTDDGVEYVKEATGVVADWWRKEFAAVGYDVLNTLDKQADELVMQWLNGNTNFVVAVIAELDKPVAMALVAKVSAQFNTREYRDDFANLLELKSEN